MYAVYILYSEKLNKYYIGFTSDINDRLCKHNRAHKGFTSRGQPWKVVYTENYLSKEEAMVRVKELKNWKDRTRLERLMQVGSEHPGRQAGRVGPGSTPSTPTKEGRIKRKRRPFFFTGILINAKFNSDYYHIQPQNLSVPTESELIAVPNK